MDEQHGKVGKYTIVSKIGDGGMAEVFLGHFRGEGDFEKVVAIKKILPNLASNERFRRNFINEARICAKLHHHNIVEVYDFIQEGSDLYLVMEYIDGLTLENVFAYHRDVEQEITTDVIFAILVQILEGLDYAHSATDPITKEPLNVIHRDLKPSNILIDDRGIVKIVDFGVAKAAIQRYETQEFTAKGSPSYMAPEQVLDTDEVTQASDVFAAGSIFYELLTLDRLFDGPNVFAILKQLSTLDIDAHLDKTIRGADRRFLKILKKALSREVSERYQQAGEMLQDLNTLLHGVLNRRRLADLLRKIRNLDENVEDAATRLVTNVEAILAEYDEAGSDADSADDPPAKTPKRPSPASKIVPDKLDRSVEEDTATIQSDLTAEDLGGPTLTQPVPSEAIYPLLNHGEKDARPPAAPGSPLPDPDEDDSGAVGVSRARVLDDPTAGSAPSQDSDPDETVKAPIRPGPSHQRLSDKRLPSILGSMETWPPNPGAGGDIGDEPDDPSVDVADDDRVPPPAPMPVNVGSLHESGPSTLAPILFGACLGLVILVVIALLVQ